MSGMLRRPLVGRLLAMVHLLLLLVCIAISVYLLTETHSQEILKDPDAAEAIRGLRIAALVMAIPSLLFGMAGVALWFRRKWGWWLGLGTSITTLTMFIYDQWDERAHPDAEMWFFTAGFALLTIWFFLPGVRNYLVASTPVKAPVDEPKLTETL